MILQCRINMDYKNTKERIFYDYLHKSKLQHQDKEDKNYLKFVINKGILY